jgi:hypothetical protein
LPEKFCTRIVNTTVWVVAVGAGGLVFATTKVPGALNMLTVALLNCVPGIMPVVSDELAHS